MIVVCVLEQTYRLTERWLRGRYFNFCAPSDTLHC